MAAYGENLMATHTRSTPQGAAGGDGRFSFHRFERLRREPATMTSVRLSAEGEWGHAGLAGRERATARLRRLEGSDHERLDQLIASFARAINSDVALLCQPGGKGQPPVLVCSRALGAARELAGRPMKEGSSTARLGRSARSSDRSIRCWIGAWFRQATHPSPTRSRLRSAPRPGLAGR
jgi:hypothetical protein